MIQDNALFRKRSEENYYSYGVRLYQNKDEYKLSWAQIGDLLNENFNMHKTESAHRKFLSAFVKGMQYQQNIKSANPNIAMRILALSDFHFPFQLPVETFNEYIGKVDIMVLNGDLLDMQSISKFIKTHRISLIDELIGAREYFIKLIRYLAPKKVVVIYGNHEARLGTHLASKLDSEANQLLPDNALDLLFDIGFNHHDKQMRARTFYEPISEVCTETEIVNASDWKYRVGKTLFAHPLSFSSPTLKTVGRAVDYFHATETEIFDCVVLAHTHRRGNSPKGRVEMFEQGCCCDINQLRYRDGTLSLPHQQGFLYLCQDKDGNLLKDCCELVKLN